MRTIKWHFETNKVGSDCDGEFEVEDDVTDEEIEEMVRDEISNIASWGWREVGKDGDA